MQISRPCNVGNHYCYNYASTHCSLSYKYLVFIGEVEKVNSRITDEAGDEFVILRCTPDTEAIIYANLTA